MWLGEQITARGVGNGISLIIFAGIVANLPHALAATARARPHRRDLDASSSSSSCRDVGRRHRRHRLHGAGAAAHPGAVSEAPAGQQDVRRRGLAPAAQDQHLGRHPADLRLVAAAAAGDARQLRAPAAEPAWLGDDHRLSRARQAALHAALCRADRVLLASSTPRSSSTRSRRPTICANTAASSRASGRARTPPTISTTC